MKLDRFTQLPCHTWCGPDCTCYPYRIQDQDENKKEQALNEPGKFL